MADIREVAVNHSTTDVTLVTTAETVIISSGPAVMPFRTHRVLVLAWAQLLIGAAGTHVTPRIRRGTAVGGTLVGDATAEEIKTAAADREPFFIMVSEQRANEDSVEYSLTLELTAATGNSTAVQAAIAVVVL